MNKIILALLGTVVSSIVLAQSIGPPVIEAGDTWVYRNTTEKGPSGWNQTREEITVLRATSTSVYYSSKPSGSNQPPRELVTGADWSRMRDINGVQTVMNKPLSFPLDASKSWDLQYTEQHPNKAHRFEQWSTTYKVIGYQGIEVPAGKFNALKIEAEGKWIAQLEPTSTVVQGAQVSQSNTTAVTQVQKTSADTVSGRTYKAFWYVPEVKRWVKSVEEYYGSNGVRNERYTSELESFKVGK